MGGKHNKCCCGGCTIASDEFNRDATDLGAAWTHPASTWKTVPTPPLISGYAEVTGSPSAIAIHNTSHPMPHGSGVVYLDIINEVNNSGMKYRAIVNAVDKDSYHFAEFIRNGASDSVLRLGISSGGADTILESKVIDTLSSPGSSPRRMYVNIADNEFCATVSHCIFSFVSTQTPLIATGYKAGMGGDLGAQFSYWEYLQHHQTKKECPSCLCHCEDSYIPPKLSANLVGTGRMAGLSCDIEMTWNRTDGAWVSATETCCNQGWQLKLTCPTGPAFDPGTAQLLIVIGCKNSDSINTGPDYLGLGHRLANSLSTCDPLSLVFGPFNVGFLDFACGCGSSGSPGQYTITVTESP